MSFKILLATNNPHKLLEIREILTPYDIVVYGIDDLNLHPKEVDENGLTYYENALIKANSLKDLTDIPIIADDSGLEVEAMNNKPGIHSARYAKEHDGHENAMKEILKIVKDAHNDKARFVCDIVMVNLEESPLLFEGITNGTIKEKEGHGGFGYDPIFVEESTNISYAKMTSEEKNIYSHRAKAIMKMVSYLKDKRLI